MRKIDFLVAILIFVSSIVLAGCKKTTQTVNTDTSSQIQQTDSATDTATNFENIKTPHFVSSDPFNNDTLAKAPENVLIVFNFNLVTGSKISLKTNGQEVTSASAKISTDKLSMTVPVSINQSGNYETSYTACWPDGSCHNGSFGFVVKLP